MPITPSPGASSLTTAPAKAVQQAGKSLQAKSSAQIRKAAKDFEAILAEQLLKTARRTSSHGRGSLFPKSSGRDIQEGMVDEQMARAMTKGRGLGLGDYLATQLLRTTGTKHSSSPINRSIFQGETVKSPGGSR